MVPCSQELGYISGASHAVNFPSIWDLPSLNMDAIPTFTIAKHSASKHQSATPNVIILRWITHSEPHICVSANTRRLRPVSEYLGSQ